MSGVAWHRLANARPMQRPRVVVLGDVILDRYTWGVTGIGSIVLTMDGEGIAVADDKQCVHLQTRPCEVCDITGAGDMVLAVLGYGVAVGWPLVEAATIANVAAGLEVERFDVEPVTWREILEADHKENSTSLWGGYDVEEAVAFAVESRQRGQTVVFTNGCFDLFHAGHLHTLQSAKKSR